MKITLLFVLQIGSNMPELYEAVDEYVHDDNPAFLDDKIAEVKKHVARGELADYALAETEVPDTQVLGLFTRPSLTSSRLQERER